MRLIDADALLEKLSDKNVTLLSALIEEQRATAFYVYFKVVDAIEKMPTIDAVPVVHGHWELSHFKGMLTCSNCRQYYISTDEAYDFNYCPHCMAKMDEVTP